MAVDERANAQHAVPGRGLAELAVYRAGRVYRAVCLNFGIAVERESPDDALDEVLALVQDYVGDCEADGMTWAEMQRPIPRAARIHIFGQLLLSDASRLLSTLPLPLTMRHDVGGPATMYRQSPV